jgi:hypothetical protein
MHKPAAIYTRVSSDRQKEDHTIASQTAALIEYAHGHHGLLNDFVRQRRDAQRALPPVGLRYIHSSRGLCPVRTTVNPAVQIGKPTLQPGLILFPSHAIHPGRSLPLQRVKAVPEQIHAQMVEQSSESVPSPFPSRLTHTAQSLGHPFPALCRASVGRSDVE